MHLDALFVDEGFGTLDSEALQLAMDELDRLREGGRTVGLISHVSELRERIRTGIEVQPTDSGSDISVGAVPGVRTPMVPARTSGWLKPRRLA